MRRHQHSTHLRANPWLQNLGGCAPLVLQPWVCPRKILWEPSHFPLAQCWHPEHSTLSLGNSFPTLPLGFSTVAFKQTDRHGDSMTESAQLGQFSEIVGAYESEPSNKQKNNKKKNKKKQVRPICNAVLVFKYYSHFTLEPLVEACLLILGSKGCIYFVCISFVLKEIPKSSN